MTTTNLPTQQATNPTEYNYFNSYYQTQAPISGPKYDAVYTFFLSRTNNNKDAARSLTASLLEIAYSSGVDPMLILDDFKKYNKNESFKLALIGLFNGTRRNTSKIGFATQPTPTPQVSRNIRN
jgi:hypothetical protein